MEATKIFKAAALAALFLAGTVGVAPAQEKLVSGEPHFGFFEGVTIQANGPVISEERATEAPSQLVYVEGRSIVQGELDTTELAGLNPELFIGLPEVETNGNLTGIAIASIGLPEDHAGEELPAVAKRLFSLVKGWFGAGQAQTVSQ